VSQTIRSHGTSGTEKPNMDAMAPRRNLLILKGNVPWKVMLDLLDQLLNKVAAINGLQYTPQPWQVFSLVCASGEKRYVKPTPFSSRRSHDTVRWLFSSAEARRVQMNAVRS
jgi:hypothetical protein